MKRKGKSKNKQKKGKSKSYVPHKKTESFEQKESFAMNTKKIYTKNKCQYTNKMYEIDDEEITNLLKFIDTGYFDFKQDTLDLYEKNIIFDEEIANEKNEVLINEDFYKNIPLEKINTIKDLLTKIKKINIYDLNYDFIKKLR